MGTKGIGVKCLVFAALLVIVILLCENGKLGFEGGGTPDLTPSEYENFIKKHPVAFIKFYAPWCGFCKRISGTMDELSDSYKNDPKVGIGKVDLDKYKDLASKMGVRGFPTLKIFKNGQFVGDYKGERTVPAFRQFIETHK